MDQVAFALHIGDPASPYADPPDDPLHELTPLEMGLERFCFEHNRGVALTVGDVTLALTLWSDFSLEARDLPGAIAALSRTGEIHLGFPESSLDVALTPSGAMTVCAIAKYGVPPRWIKRLVVDRQEVVRALTGFMDELVRRAIDAGYVRPEDAQDYWPTYDGRHRRFLIDQPDVPSRREGL